MLKDFGNLSAMKGQTKRTKTISVDSSMLDLKSYSDLYIKLFTVNGAPKDFCCSLPLFYFCTFIYFSSVTLQQIPSHIFDITGQLRASPLFVVHVHVA